MFVDTVKTRLFSKHLGSGIVGAFDLIKSDIQKRLKSRMNFSAHKFTTIDSVWIKRLGPLHRWGLQQIKACIKNCFHDLFIAISLENISPHIKVKWIKPLFLQISMTAVRQLLLKM